MKKLFRWVFDTDKDRRLEILQRVTLFRGLRRNLLMKLLVDLVEKEYQAGDIVFAEGEMGNALYIVLDGSVALTKRCGDTDTVLDNRAAGSYFGELALIDRMPRFATAVAQEPTTLLIMYRSYFEDLIHAGNAISARLLQNLVVLLAAYIRKNQAAEDNDRS